MTTVHEEGGDLARLSITRKRTKRQRTASPPAAAGELLSEAREEATMKEMVMVVGEGATEEDEDMANCLMLLAQGRRRRSFDHQMQNSGFFSDKKQQPQGTLGLGLDGVYQCKTCDKSFPSFQALGGHRASHKKPKNGPTVGSDLKSEEKKPAFAFGGETRESNEAVLGSFLSLQVTSNSSKKPDKIHECSICKAEFSSGQALGGHMRRHRSTVTANANAAASNNNVGDSESSSDRIIQESKRSGNFLELDLNLPAPEDDHSEKPRFSFVSKDHQILVFAAASNSLIDCHN